MKTCLRGHVSGKVQGVSFRTFVRTEALAAGVSGWARNSADGRVEVLLCGDEAALEKVVRALHQGPPLATVAEVDLHTTAWTDVTGFTIG